MSISVYPVLIQKGESGKYIAECTSIPGCRSQGETVEDARANVQEAIELCIEDMRERGEPLPEPATAF